MVKAVVVMKGIDNDDGGGGGGVTAAVAVGRRKEG